MKKNMETKNPVNVKVNVNPAQVEGTVEFNKASSFFREEEMWEIKAILIAHGMYGSDNLTEAATEISRLLGVTK